MYNFTKSNENIIREIFLRICLTFCFLGLIACHQSKAPESSEPLLKKEIQTLIDQWHLDAAKAKFVPYFEFLDSTAVFIGTDASEIWSKQAFSSYSKPHFDKGKAWSFLALERNIYLDDEKKTAWFDELLDTHMGLCRGSGILLKKSGVWKLQHYVLSLTIPNDHVNQIKSINQRKDSIYKEKYRIN